MQKPRHFHLANVRFAASYRLEAVRNMNTALNFYLDTLHTIHEMRTHFLRWHLLLRVRIGVVVARLELNVYTVRVGNARR